MSYQNRNSSALRRKFSHFNFTCLLASGLLALSCLAKEDEIALPQLVEKIPLPDVKGEFDLMAMDWALNNLLVAATDNNSVEVIDVTKNKWLGRVTNVNQPKWVVCRPELNKVFVSNAGDGSVRVFWQKSLGLSKTIPFKEKSNNLRYDAKAKLLYVGVGKTFGLLGIINAERDTVEGEIPLANFPKQFELEKNGPRIFVNVPSANHVAVVDREKRTVIATWPVKEAKENVPMAFDEATQSLFIGCTTGKLVVMETGSGKSVASVDISEDCDGIYYDAKRQLIYVSCGAGFIDVIQQTSADNYKHIGKVPTAPGAATSLFVPELDKIFLAVPQKENQQAELRIYKVK